MNHYFLKAILIILSCFPPQKANYYGSLFQSSSVCLGSGPQGEVNIPFCNILPMVHPNDIVFDGMNNVNIKLIVKSDLLTGAFKKLEPLKRTAYKKNKK